VCATQRGAGVRPAAHGVGAPRPRSSRPKLRSAAARASQPCGGREPRLRSPCRHSQPQRRSLPPPFPSVLPLATYHGTKRCALWKVQLPLRAPTSARRARMPQSLRQPARPVPRGSLPCGKYCRRCSRAAHEAHRLVIFRCHRRTAQPGGHLRTSVRRTDTACPRPGPRGGLGARRGAGLGWARRQAALSRCSCALLDWLTEGIAALRCCGADLVTACRAAPGERLAPRHTGGQRTLGCACAANGAAADLHVGRRSACCSACARACAGTAG
jgi:hypothetical protein